MLRIKGRFVPASESEQGICLFLSKKFDFMKREVLWTGRVGTGHWPAKLNLIGRIVKHACGGRNGGLWFICRKKKVRTVSFEFAH